MKHRESSATSKRGRRCRETARALGIAVGLIVALVAAGSLAKDAGAHSGSGTAADIERLAGSGGQYGTRVRFELLGSRADGATGAPRTDTSDNLGQAEDTTRTLFAGRTGNLDLCDIGSLRINDAPSGFYVWEVHARVLAVSPAETTLDLDWRRSRTDGAEAPITEANRTVTLEGGGVRVLDFVRDGNPASKCASALLQVRADPLPRPGPQPELTYDLWLVSEGVGGNRSAHRRVVGRSGQPVRFQLDTLVSSLFRNVSPSSQTPAPVTLTASGRVLATLGPDQSMAVTVQAIRSVKWSGAELRGEGNVEFRSGPGETVVLALPQPVGRVTGPPVDLARPVVDGVVTRADRTVVDFARFFAGTRTSLYVRITQNTP